MKHCSKEFKEEELKLSDEIGVKKAAQQLGIAYYTLADWRSIDQIKTIWCKVMFFKIINYNLEIPMPALHFFAVFSHSFPHSSAIERGVASIRLA